ncbi:MAG: protein kinase [Deltaproteobacteria bacterium]|nr:protein kinase [Deltaproteobacteria bacterium]
MIGKTISHYKILEKLGEGGMGVVYKAEDTKLKRTVALKFLPPELTRDKEAKDRFIHEARAAAGLDHNNICAVHEIDETKDGQMYIAMACYEGETLKEKIEKGPLKIDLSLDFAIQIAEGIKKAHQKDIIHRDIKSANIIITKDSVAKILDFGLAKLKGHTKLTKEGTTLGTVSYMSPEQASGENVDHRSDIWSLGVVLYEMITGQLPFKGEYDQAVMYSIMNDEPEPLTGLRTGVPMELERIIKKNLAKDPAERYQHTEEIIVDIKHLMKNLESEKSTAQPAKPKPPRRRKHTDLISSQKTPERSISQRLSKSSKGTFVGRKQELNILMSAFEATELPFVVAYIHGPGGIGKSFLIHHMIDRITSDGCRGIYIDCRDTEPTTTGFFDRLSTSLGMKVEETTSDDFYSLISKSGERTLLCLDHYENFTLMDTWLRQVFVPTLPDTALTVIVSRYAPMTAWFTSPGWQNLFKVIELKELSDQESIKMLETRSLNPNQIKRVKKFAHGHPLALELGAAALRSQPDLKIHSGPPTKIVSQLSRVLLSGLSHDIMKAVEAASTVRWTTEPILRAILELSETRDIFDELEQLPFVYNTLEGLILHDVVQEAVSTELSFRDPERYCLYRSRAWRFFSTQSRRAQEHRLWRLTAEMLYLIENPIIREAFFPKGSSEYSLQPATADNHAEIIEIARSEETPEASRLTEQWLNLHPDSFFVAKGPDEKVEGFYFCFEPDKVNTKLLSSDPLTAAWMNHLKQHPVKPKERVLFLRRWLARGTGDDFSPVQGACWLNIKQTYMAMRPNLRRLYTTVNDLAAYAPVVIPLCFKPIDDAHVELGGRIYHSALLDFGEDSVDGWLKGLVKAELGVDST